MEALGRGVTPSWIEPGRIRPAASGDGPCSPWRHGGAWQGGAIELDRASFTAFCRPRLWTGLVHHGGMEALGRGVTPSWIAPSSTHSPAASGDRPLVHDGSM